MKCPNCGSTSMMEYPGEYECFDCGYIFPSGINPKKNIALQSERHALVKRLASKYEYLCITHDDIIDEMLDIELYNQKLQKREKLDV